MKKEIVKILKNPIKELKVDLNEQQIQKIVEVHPSSEFGDYSFPCFFLEEKLKMSPDEIALKIREKIGDFPETEFDDIQTNGPYLNFFVSRKGLARKTVWDIITQKKNFGKSNIGNKKKILVEFSSPNIAKPF